MTDLRFAHDARTLVRHLGAAPESWRRRDLVRFCLEEGIRIVNLRYPSFDGKLRELRVPVTGEDSLDRLLAGGERVDGSSLFPGLFGTAASDLYAVPVYRWAFLDPWSDDELHVVCRFADAAGRPCPLTPDTILAEAARRLRETVGLQLLALAELELYLILDHDGPRFSGRAQRGYHQSAPYAHGRAIADDMLRTTAAILGRVKYAHAEVGYIDRLASEDPELDGRRVEQYEVELDLMPVEDLGCWLPVARWLLRAVADRHGASATFVPKLDEGMAGTGMHLHLALQRDGRNVMTDGDGTLSEEALALIGGVLERSPSLAAFGNTVTASYLRLVPGQEAPTIPSWGPRDRTSLIRIPLDFRTEVRPDLEMNPHETEAWPEAMARPTVEYRSPDGSAFPVTLLAAVTATAARAEQERERFADLARRLRGPEHDAPPLPSLPRSAVEAASRLREAQEDYVADGFAPELLDQVARSLEREADEDLTARLAALPAAERLVESRRLMHKDLHKH